MISGCTSPACGSSAHRPVSLEKYPCSALHTDSACSCAQYCCERHCMNLCYLIVVYHPLEFLRNGRTCIFTLPMIAPRMRYSPQGLHFEKQTFLFGVLCFSRTGTFLTFFSPSGNQYLRDYLDCFLFRLYYPNGNKPFRKHLVCSADLAPWE